MVELKSLKRSLERKVPLYLLRFWNYYRFSVSQTSKSYFLLSDSQVVVAGGGRPSPQVRGASRREFLQEGSKGYRLIIDLLIDRLISSGPYHVPDVRRTLCEQHVAEASHQEKAPDGRDGERETREAEKRDRRETEGYGSGAWTRILIIRYSTVWIISFQDTIRFLSL